MSKIVSIHSFRGGTGKSDTPCTIQQAAPLGRAHGPGQFRHLLPKIPGSRGDGRTEAARRQADGLRRWVQRRWVQRATTQDRPNGVEYNGVGYNGGVGYNDER